MALSGFGFVKEVLSGDTLVIIGQPRNGPPPELKLTLSSLQAPRLALKPTTMSATNLTTKDQEPFAWESRQFLRELCIGKRIFFKVEYTVQAIGRQFGAVYLLGDNSEGNLFGGNSEAKLGENVCLTVAREGWCTVRVREKGAEEEKSVDFDQLLTLSREAEAAKRGIFNTAEAQKSIRTVKWDFLQEKENNNTQSEVIKLYNQVKEKPVNAIIEYIRDGASVKALLLDSMTLITFNLAGVQCPRMNLSARATDEKATDPQEYAQEAKFFTEVRLLNREVKLRIGGVSEKFATFFGSIIHEVEEPGRSAVVDGIKYNGSIDFGSANGKKKKTYDIAVELIRNGLAMPTDWSMSYTTASNAAAIHAAVHVAKAAKLRLWKTYVAPVIPGDKEYTGVVTEVLSGDSFVVLVGSTQDLALQPWACEERKINLSSIRAPRLNRSGVDEPFARESKEFVRKKLIGKVVKVEVEYVIQGESGAGRKYGTVKANSNKVESNIACLLLEEGLASVIGHKQGAERSNYYHDLLEAEKVAKDQKKNIWDQEIKAKSDDEKQRKPIEVTTAQLAKTHLSSLKSDNFEKRVRGIVDYVFNGARMKIYVPSTNIYIVYNLSGVQCGRTADGKGKAPQKSDPFSEEATAYTKSLCLQRDVELLVEAVDKGGNFIGSLFFKPPAYSLKPPANSGAVSAPASSSYASKFSGQTSKRNPKAAGDMFTENLAIVLLQNGLAKVNKFGVKMARFGEEYLKEERNAKDSGIRLWENYVEVPEEEVDEEEAAELKKKETRNAKSKQMETIQVTVCHIDDGNNFHVHVKSEESKLKAVNERMEKLAAEYGLVPKIENPELMSTIQKNADVVALFDDGSKPKWYRAKVLRIIKNENGTRSANIQYCDFGNVEDVGADRLRVPNDATIFKTESLAHPCCLAFVTAPDLSNEYGQDAAMYLSQLTAPPRCLEAKVHGKDPKTNKLVLTLIPAGQTVKSKIANSAEETIATSSANDVSDVVVQGEVNAPKPTESASFKSGITVNGLLLKEGFVTMSKKARVYLWGNDEEQEIFEQMKKDQEYAHVNHMHLWEFGDPRPDEDDQRF